MGCSVTYKFWTRQELLEHMLRQCTSYNLPTEVVRLVDEACKSYEWNPTEDFDGCSVVQDRHHPYVPCFIHDYMWITGMGGKQSDELLYILLKKTGMKKTKAKFWYIGVRIGWFLGYRRIHINRRNIKPFTYKVKNVLDYYGITYFT